MAKIYQFPHGSERKRLKDDIARERRKRFARRSGNKALKYSLWGWFWLRFVMAGGLHVATVVVLAVLGGFSKLIFWIGGLLCLVTWFTLNHQYWAKNNYTIPVIISVWLLSLAATPLINLLNRYRLFHWILLPDAGTQEGQQRDVEADL